MTGARGCCLTPHVERAQVGGICKRLQRLGITECLNGGTGGNMGHRQKNLAMAAKSRNGM
ncbi:hypothetical protein LUW10_05625 [Pseudomonas veronii]|jgi:hypothetical protein|uniref:hypothetical protein n=1 Tax=Pseudomonas veronii TaxID=76761 RepID=UPI001E468854|nr:hypothetical protein [Pseudomonas veronii]MDF3240523.1 hypothetical protein [Pseudomonas veronii]UHH31307.1 hypothetical protein LUW10_05625 [Pseudomonas veronii]